MKRLLIAGIGSGQPGDDLGWRALEQLQPTLSPDGALSAELLCIEHPALDLLPALRGRAGAVLLDALADPGAGTRLLTLDQLAVSRDAGCSAHGFSVAEALRLGEALGLLPPRLTLIGLGDDWPQALPGLLAEALRRSEIIPTCRPDGFSG